MKLESELGAVDGEPRMVVVLNIKLGPKLETVLDSALCTLVILDIKLGSKLGTVLDRELCTVVFDIRLVSILGIALGTEQGTTLGSELGATKSKMNICIPTGNLRL
jgi:hypothetical protein